MKNILTVILLFISSALAFSQENMITLSGGYAFSNIEDSDINSTGYRINALFEFNPMGEKWAHGFSIGFLNQEADASTLINRIKFKVQSIPFYYAPKFIIGSGNFKVFIKAAFGAQYSSLKRTGTLGELSDNDFGLAGGGGAGLMYTLSEKVFINAEYELLWMSNSYYSEGLLNTASMGIGFKF